MRDRPRSAFVDSAVERMIISQLVAAAGFTIASRNELAQARVLARAFREHHPSDRFFLVLLDGPEGVAPEREPFEVLPASELGAREWKQLAFQYDARELTASVKPRAFRHLFERHHF